MRNILALGLCLIWPSIASGAELNVSFEHPAGNERHNWDYQEISPGSLPSITIDEGSTDPWRVHITVEEVSDTSVTVQAEIFKLSRTFWGRERAHLVSSPRVQAPYGVEARISQGDVPEEALVLTVLPSWSLADF